jgi:hypothetical protein
MTISNGRWRYDAHFIHSFDPASASPIAGPTVDLEVSEIEDAGIREVLQTPGAAYGAWSILDALLTATGPGTPFIFKEPLVPGIGESRHIASAKEGGHFTVSQPIRLRLAFH